MNLQEPEGAAVASFCAFWFLHYTWISSHNLSQEKLCRPSEPSQGRLCHCCGAQASEPLAWLCQCQWYTFILELYSGPPVLPVGVGPHPIIPVLRTNSGPHAWQQAKPAKPSHQPLTIILIFFFSFFGFIYVFCLCLCMHSICVPVAHGGQKSGSDLLELEIMDGCEPWCRF